LTKRFTAPGNRVERCFNRLKQFRRIATRYEKKAETYLAIAGFSLYPVVVIVLKHALVHNGINKPPALFT
jgi:hypothetical protein